MKKFFFLIPPPRILRRASFILILFCIPSCKEDPPVLPPPPQPKLTIAVDDVSCTETWLNLKLENIALPVDLELKKDSIVIKTFLAINSTDTTLYVDSLVPKQPYNFHLTSIQNQVSSNQLSITTMDTTSHNFTWQTFEFGQHSSSVLYDVAIIDENNIWAVGEIYMNDSLGITDPTLYNLIKWNGQEWMIERVYYNYQGSNFIAPLHSIYAFSANNIWVGSNQPMRWNGSIWQKWNLLGNIWNGWINKIWGSSSDLYLVGNNGNIAHYNGSQWTKIESGTTLHLIDIYGYDDSNVYAAGVNISEAKGVLLKGNSQNQFSPMITGEIINPNELFQKLYGELSSVWIDDNNTIYTGGNLLYNFKNNKWDYVRSLPENYIGGNPGTYYRGFIYSIRGNASNDYIIAGDRNTLKHFNGITWEQIGLPYTPSSSIIWFSVNFKPNIVVAVGTEDGKAKIIVLNRV